MNQRTPRTPEPEPSLPPPPTPLPPRRVIRVSWDARRELVVERIETV